MDNALSEKPADERRLWIGNLDWRITEYQLLKIVQTYGPIEKFDLLFHRNGPQVGQPRGYAFVTYQNEASAVNAKGKLHNLLLGQKRISVTWAHSISHEEIEKPKQEIHIPALAMSKQEHRADRHEQIQAIEAKLKLMERKPEVDLKINDTVASKQPVIAQFQQNKPSNVTVKLKPSHLKRSKPYNKPVFHR